MNSLVQTPSIVSLVNSWSLRDIPEKMSVTPGRAGPQTGATSVSRHADDRSKDRCYNSTPIRSLLV
jgi:hypothetical protein